MARLEGKIALVSGAAPQGPEHASLEDWRSVHRTNLDGVFLGCKHAIRAMRPAGAGSIINISSGSGLVGIPAAAYASSKAAIRNHMRRFGRADEIAALAVLLASDEAAYMTGTELNIDGGLMAGAVAVPDRK